MPFVFQAAKLNPARLTATPPHPATPRGRAKWGRSSPQAMLLSKRAMVHVGLGLFHSCFPFLELCWGCPGPGSPKSAT